jgi:hypothetical protein
MIFSLSIVIIHGSGSFVTGRLITGHLVVDLMLVNIADNVEEVVLMDDYNLDLVSAASSGFKESLETFCVIIGKSRTLLNTKPIFLLTQLAC